MEIADVESNAITNGIHVGENNTDSLKVKAVRSRLHSGSSGSRSSSRSPRRDSSRRGSSRDSSPARDVRDASPGLSRTMRESISVDLAKYTDKEAVKWLIWLAEANISKVGECQENHSTASFLSVIEKIYGKSNVVKCMEVLLGAVGKWDAAEKVAKARMSHSGIKNRRQEDANRVTLTVKLKATLPQLMRRRNEIENDLRDLVEDDDNDVLWERVTLGGATVQFKMSPTIRQRLEMLQEDEWKELGGLPILKYQFGGEKVVTVSRDDRETSDAVLVSAKYDKRKHKSEAQLLGVVLAQKGIRVLDPLYRQLEVWEDGSFDDAFVDGEDGVKYDLVCADDVEDAESVSSFNERGVPVILISFDTANTETESSRLIYHLPWMFTMLMEKLKRKPPPPIIPPVPLIFENQSSASIALKTETPVGAMRDVNGNEEAPKDSDVGNSSSSDEDDVKSVSFVPASTGSLDESISAGDAEVVAESVEGATESVEGAEDSVDAASIVVASTDDPVSDSSSTSEDNTNDAAAAAVEVAEESVLDFKEKETPNQKSTGNEPEAATGTNVEPDDPKDLMNWTMHKVILIGDSSVGKTSILSRFSDQVFNTNFISTVGIDFKVKKVKRDKRKVKLQIWDTAGQERYRTITAAFYRGTSAFVVVYDVTQMTTFLNVRTWLNQISANTDMGGHVIVLVGNKADLESSRQVPRETAQNLADELNIKYFETSAKTGENVTEFFHHVADVLPTEDEEEERSQDGNDRVDLNGEKPPVMPHSRCRC